MGTVFSVDIRHPGVDGAVLDSAIRWLHWVDDTFSTYQPDSQISRLGRGEVAISDCAPEVAAVLARCAELGTETDGYFSAYADGALDPSGLVKGWAIEQVSDLLRAGGSINHCVNGGGDVQCAGRAEPGRPWRIAITDPLRHGEYAGIVAGHSIAVATSGTAERGAHIVNPHDGCRPRDLVSVSLAGARLATVDAYATAVFAMGSAGRDWIESHPEYRAMIIYADGSRWSSPGFAA